MTQPQADHLMAAVLERWKAGDVDGAAAWLGELVRTRIGIDTLIASAAPRELYVALVSIRTNGEGPYIVIRVQS